MKTRKTLKRATILAVTALLLSFDGTAQFQRAEILEGAPNFRDLGDYPAADGQRTVPRKVFRSPTLAALTDRDVETLKTLNIRTVIDFRGDDEVAKEPSRLPEGVRVVRLPIEVGNTGALPILQQLMSGEVDSLQSAAWMESINRQFASEFTPQYREFFEILLRPESYPVVFHCTAGKDRTGFAAALLLSALGVDRETVMADYLLTNRFLKPSPQLSQVPDRALPAIRQLWGVQPAYLNAARDEMMRRSGTVDRYLQEELGVGEAEKSRLRQLLLE
jgi:protein-tyrosine phosphatase